MSHQDPAPTLVDLARVRFALDRLVELHGQGVDVPGLLAAMEDDDVSDDTNPPAAVSLRLPASMLAAADALVAPLRHRPEALAAGGNWGRSAVLRLALARGLVEIAAEIAHEAGAPDDDR